MQLIFQIFNSVPKKRFVWHHPRMLPSANRKFSVEESASHHFCLGPPGFPKRLDKGECFAPLFGLPLYESFQHLRPGMSGVFSDTWVLVSGRNSARGMRPELKRNIDFCDTNFEISTSWTDPVVQLSGFVTNSFCDLTPPNENHGRKNVHKIRFDETNLQIPNNSRLNTPRAGKRF